MAGDSQQTIGLLSKVIADNDRSYKKKKKKKKGNEMGISQLRVRSLLGLRCSEE